MKEQETGVSGQGDQRGSKNKGADLDEAKDMAVEALMLHIEVYMTTEHTTIKKDRFDKLESAQVTADL